jgi:hypothetical protein
MRGLSVWHTFHGWRTRTRWCAKLVLFVVALLLVLYPRLWLLPPSIARLWDLNSVLDPAHPGLQPLAERVQALAPAPAPAEAVQDAVQQVVYEQVPYAFDWETWGVVEYLPTVEETLRAGREDCDGRAVIAASLLRRLGHDAWLVSDFKHTWVLARDPATQAEARGLMAPGAGGQSLIADETGTRAVLDRALFANLGRGLAFGISVFPLLREVLLLAVIAVLTLHPWSSRGQRLAGLALLVVALVAVRWAGAAPAGGASLALLWGGVVAAVAGWLFLAFKRREKGAIGGERSVHVPGAGGDAS